MVASKQNVSKQWKSDAYSRAKHTVDLRTAKPRLDVRGLPTDYAFQPEWEVTPRQVKVMLQQHQLTLIDCRTPPEHAIAHLAPAKLIPLQDVPHRLSELTPLRRQKVVLYCHYGSRSLRLAMWLREQGFTDVKSMAGGIDLWALDIEPTMPRY